MCHPIGSHVGKRIRRKRWINGTTQQQLADIVGIDLQQVQECESGVILVNALLITEIAAALGVPASYFFEDLEPLNEASPSSK